MIRNYLMKAAVALTATATLPLIWSPSAQAASCQYFAFSGIRVCGTWNSTITNVNDLEYAKTSSFTWSVTRLDSTLRITNVSVRTGGESLPGPWSKVTGWHVIKVYSRAATGTSVITPSWAGRWGRMFGEGNYQMSNLTLTWCHGTTCKTVTTENVGGGNTDFPNPVS